MLLILWTFLLYFPVTYSQTFLDDLTLTFGESRIAFHQLSSSSFHFHSNSFITSSVSLPRGLVSDSIPTSSGLNVICSDYASAALTQEALTTLIGSQKFHPLYVSRQENTVCFVAQIHSSSLTRIQEISSIRSYGQIPSQLKIHPSVLLYLDLITQDRVPAKFLQHFPQMNQTSFSRSSIVITFGLGVVSKLPSDADSELSQPRLEDIQKKFLNRSAVEDLESFLSQRNMNINRLRSSHSVPQTDNSNDIWKAAHSTLRVHAAASSRTSSTSTLCPDHLLNLETSPSSSDLVINNISDYMRSISSPVLRQACVVSLLSHLLTNHGSILDIRMRFPNYPFNLYNKGIVQNGTYSQTYPYHAKGLDGTGQIVGIGDTGIDELSCFFRNSDNSKVARSSYTSPTFDLTKRKVIQYINYADSRDLGDGHGTHVAGTVAGSSIDSSFVAHNGHAPGAKIAFFDMEYSSAPQNGIVFPSPIGRYVFQVAYDSGARLHSNSWGSVYNFYDSDVLSIDNFHSTHVDFLALFAAGNSGDEGYYSVGYPAISKNAMAIGASMSDSSNSYISRVAYFSGLGPTFDNRIKPDVVAPGYFTTSARASSSTTSATCSVLDMAGTSMATPLVAGVAAQIRQYFQSYDTLVVNARCKFFTGTGTLQSQSCGQLSNPKGATVKALLIHSGEPMAMYDNRNLPTVQRSIALTKTPDMLQGFGRVFLRNVLPFPGIESVLSLHVVETSLTSQQECTHTIVVTDTSRPLKITIVWMDPDNSLISEKMLLNNLDLRVLSPAGETLYGNNIAGDEVNNVEQITIARPVVGEYVILVTSSYLVTSTQSVSLIVTGGMLNFVSHTTSTSGTVSVDPNGCSESQRKVMLTALDHGGDGWGAGNSVQITNSAGSVVFSATLTGAAGDDFQREMAVCLTVGDDYTVSLVMTGSLAEEMGVEISPCSVYLSKYSTSATFFISSATNTFCGDCSGKYPLNLLLSGSLVGVPYGWNGNTHYALQQTAPDTSVIYQGTLVTGILRRHLYCLSSGTWTVELRDVPLTDDFFDDAQMAGYFGVEEYEMTLSNGGSGGKTLASGQLATVVVSGTTASISVGFPSPSRFPTRSPSVRPTTKPSTGAPTRAPLSTAPTRGPTNLASRAPSRTSSVLPSKAPTRSPTRSPSRSPSTGPTRIPTRAPTLLPTRPPTLVPSLLPTKLPTRQPTRLPSRSPTLKPTRIPTRAPTLLPTRPPTGVASLLPTKLPTRQPTRSPTRLPTWKLKTPSSAPSRSPTQSGSPPVA